jgi:uncharacterized protein (UPF0210 family)
MKLGAFGITTGSGLGTVSIVWLRVGKMKITVDMVMAEKPCSRYSRERVEELWAGRESLTPTEVIELPIPAVDIGWLLRNLTRKVNRHALYFMEWESHYCHDNGDRKLIDRLAEFLEEK